MSVRIGVDTGGTFTDVVVYDDTTGDVRALKTPSTPPRFDRGVLDGIDELLDRHGIESRDVSFLSHGTTVATNVILEGRFPDVGLITNQGLEDVVEIGDQTRPELYNLQVDKPPVIVPRSLRRGVPGRVDSQGTVIEALDRTAVAAAVDDLVAAGVDAIVVSMLFSYLHPEHERRVGGIIEDHEADVDYACSSDVLPESGEYDRTITTILNQAVKGSVASYFDRLGNGIRSRDITVPVNVIHSGGGVFGIGQATDHAIRTVLSGPAAGAVATADVSAREGFGDAIGMDMGGTSTDVSLVRDGDIVRTTEGEINDLPIKMPMIDIQTVGAGGGSVAWIDDGGALRVGPRSSGADPGPICYGKGGEEPTLTDANLVLGRIDPSNFLEGNLADADARARELFEAEIADPLGQSLEDAALSVVAVANASLTREIRRVTVERGSDPADFALIAFGGAGPLHGPAVASGMDIRTVVVPPNPGVFSARGLLNADVRVDESRAFGERDEDIDPVHVADAFTGLIDEVRRRLHSQGFEADEISTTKAVDVRYVGQSYELTIPLRGDAIGSESVAATVDAFHERHERRYGHAIRDEPVEFVTLRVTGTVPTRQMEADVTGTDGTSRRGRRDAYFTDEGWIETTVHDRAALGPGQVVEGPAVLEESGSTTVLPPDTRAVVSEHGSLVIES